MWELGAGYAIIDPRFSRITFESGVCAMKKEKKLAAAAFDLNGKMPLCRNSSAQI